MLEIEIGEIVVDNEIEIGEIELDVKKVYPQLEDIEIKPSKVEQSFKSEKYYGYNIVKVNPVSADILNIIPSEEKQQRTGLFEIVNVDEIPTKYVIPKVENNVLKLSRGEVKGGVLTL